MTQFNPENKDTLTYGEALDPAMGITDQEDADKYLKDYVSYIEKQLEKEPREDLTAKEIAKINIGYYAGYYDGETRMRTERLFKTHHPIFGTIVDTLEPTKNLEE